MADATPETPETIFQIRRVYLKEASLEQPNSPAILLEEQGPNIDIQMGVEAEPLTDDLYEVKVRATVHAKIGDKTVFLVEAQEAGIFELANFPEDQLGLVLGIACPQIVYPYLRGNVADLLQRAGFPPVHMAEINFQSLYERQREAEAAAAPAQLQ
jgi:preprotein translocase subunit SecB